MMRKKIFAAVGMLLLVIGLCGAKSYMRQMKIRENEEAQKIEKQKEAAQERKEAMEQRKKQEEEKKQKAKEQQKIIKRHRSVLIRGIIQKRMKSMKAEKLFTVKAILHCRWQKN